MIIYGNHLISTANNASISVPQNKQIRGVGHTSVLKGRVKSASSTKVIDQGTTEAAGPSLAWHFRVFLKEPYQCAALMHV